MIHYVCDSCKKTITPQYKIEDILIDVTIISGWHNNEFMRKRINHLCCHCQVKVFDCLSSFFMIGLY